MPPIKSIKPKDRPLRAVGVTCGIGSMLIGARQAGFRVVGNIEWRKYYHKEDPDSKNTFTENFPGAIFPYSIEGMSEKEIALLSRCDLAIGHPECGNFSNLGGTIANRADRMKDPCDIPLFLDLVGALRPRFFVMDDLPKSLGAFTMREYAEKLPDYDLFPEWISNHGYGNVQKGRKRMFMIGSLKSERWAFTPGEIDSTIAVKDVLAGVEKCKNHFPHTTTENCQRASCLGEPGRQWSWGEVADRFLDLPAGKSWPYLSKSGEEKTRVGFLRTYWDKHSHVLTGYNAIVHPLTGLPLSIRERARIQGFPDDFIFYSEILGEDGTWEHFQNIHLIKQTGKAMPIQFCRYVSAQIADHLGGPRIPTPSGVRLLRSDNHIDSAKRWYCDNIGYADQDRACENCWMKDRCDIRVKKYGYDPGRPRSGLPIDRPIKSKKIKIELPTLSDRPGLIGRKVGIGRRMEFLIRSGVPDREVLIRVLEEYPTSRASMTDVGKVKSKMKGGER